MPPWQGNNRFYGAVISEVRHPSLSLNGFDAATSGHGLGLKQVLGEVYSGSAGPSVEDVWGEIRGLATAGATYYNNPPSRSDITHNTQVIQARAFMALASYILERNGHNQSDLRSHSAYLTDLRSALLNTSSWRINKNLNNDAVKWTRAATNMSRALDLYLALENAYQHYGDSAYGDTQSTTLLSQSEKLVVFNDYGEVLWELEDLGSEEEVFGTDGYDVQPGNWPLKVQVAVAYGALTHQNVPMSIFDLNDVAMVRRALRASLQSAGNDRYRYFNYQTNDGKRFWAEGPYYFHFALGDVIPFWHAIRINGMLGYHPDFNAPDPFFHSRFTDPLNWLADLATPEGFTPPLDDGNRHNMRFASILRWTGAYGSVSLGRKFAWIGDASGTNGFGATNDLLPVEIAIPRVHRNNGTAPAGTLPTTSSDQAGEDGEQQLIVRRHNGGNMHYLLMNGESGDAIGRGEGHEQGDQLQLLYYVNGTSYLLDSGYDEGGIIDNSTWNHYYDHNVMIGNPLQNSLDWLDGGQQAPWADNTKLRKIANHQDVSSLWRETQGNIDVLHGSVWLELLDVSKGKGPWAFYQRHLLFVNDPNEPYLVDFNGVRADPDIVGPFEFYMRYHVNGTQEISNGNDDYLLIDDIDGQDSGGSSNYLMIKPHSIEKAMAHRIQVDDSEERHKDNDPIRALSVDRGGERGHSVVSFIRALPSASSSEITALEENLPYQKYDPPSSNGLRTWNYYVWPHSSTTVDVFAARSALVGGGSTKTFSISEANDLRLKLPSSDDYGFARLTQQNGQWEIDPGYQINLVLEPRPAPPTNLVVSCVTDDSPDLSWDASPGPELDHYEILRSTEPEIGFTTVGTTTSTSHTDTFIFCADSYDADAEYWYQVVAVDAQDDVSDPSNTVSTLGSEQAPYPSYSTAADSTNTRNDREAPTKIGAARALPDAFTLETSFPNPVRTQATIRYALPEATGVTLTVYDVMGREVMRLVDGAMPLGFHEVQMDTSDLPSGTYLYRLRAGAFTQTKRMLVVR